MKALYDGLCAECDDLIHAGDSIVKAETGGWVHEVCRDRSDRPTGDVCAKHGMEMSLSGSCWICEEER